MKNLSLFDPMATQMNRVFQNFGLKPWQFDDENFFDPTVQMNRMLQGFGLKPWQYDDHRLQIKLDISEDDACYIVRADIPGVKKEDIKVDIDGNHISIGAEIKSLKEEKKSEKVVHSERYEGQIFRSFTLDCSVDQDKAKANYQDGLLELTLPKAKNGKSTRLAID